MSGSPAGWAGREWLSPHAPRRCPPGWYHDRRFDILKGMENPTGPLRPAAEPATRLAAGALRADLAAAAAEAAAPTFEEALAYLEGGLDAVDRELFETRLADDPALQAELAAVASERRALLARQAQVAAEARRQRFRWAAVAALLAVAVAGSWLVQRGAPGESRLASAPSTSAPVSADVRTVVTNANGTGARLLDGSFESGRIAEATPPDARLDFESGSLAGLATLR